MRPVPTAETELDESSGLPIYVENELATSIWELDGDDRQRLAAGGRIGVVVSEPQPPLVLAIAAPYCECGALMGWSAVLAAYTCTAHESDTDQL